MIDATVAPKVGFISPFGTTVCNVNHINARPELLPKAGARQLGKDKAQYLPACFLILPV
jgi:hypothetical protein